jgi:hypothetical protein
MDEIVVEILAELISTLALVTKKVKQRKSSKINFPGVLPY